MNHSISVKELHFENGQKISLEPGEIVLFLGPNNCGKTTALRNIYEGIAEQKTSGPIIKEVFCNKEGSDKNLGEFLSKHFQLINDGPSYALFQGQVSKHQCSNLWNRPNGFAGLRNAFFCFVKTEDRLTISKPARNIKILSEPLTHPIHYLYRHDNLEEKLSSYFHEAFNEDLILHMKAGNELPLYCGIRPKCEEGEDRASTTYARKVEALKPLHEQGDGIRSFVGVMFHTVLEGFSGLLIDEPEAFLHPPQAKLIGKILADGIQPHKQFFIATHSTSLLQGLLNARPEKMRILRLSREENDFEVTELKPNELYDVLNNPLLRFTNVLDGLFHHQVVICEADADCRFYSALGDDVNKLRSDALFVHVGGKQRLTQLITPYRHLGVKVKVIVDFDILREKKAIKSLVVSMGGPWEFFDEDYTKIKSFINGLSQPRKTAKTAINEAIKYLKKFDNEYLTTPEITDVTKILSQSKSNWDLAKKKGADCLSIEIKKSWNSLNAAMQKIGIYIVPCGEMESFYSINSLHGQKWVNKILENYNIENSPELEKARAFAKQVVAS